MIKPLLAILNYAIATGLFYSGLAGTKRGLHEFTMRRLQNAADQGSHKALLLMAKLLRYRGVSALNKVAGVSYLESLRAKLELQSGSKISQKNQKAYDHVFAEVCFLLAEAYADKTLILGAPANGSNDNKTVGSVYELYNTAAELGHKMAALRLSKAYENGLYGLEVDTQKAAHWQTQFLSGVDFE